MLLPDHLLRDLSLFPENGAPAAAAHMRAPSFCLRTLHALPRTRLPLPGERLWDEYRSIHASACNFAP